MNAIRLKKYRELFSYGIVGGLTTLLNLVLYFVMVSWLKVYYIAAEIIAWVICFVFSFVTNKIFVFESREWGGGQLWKELSRFFSSSVATGVIEVVALYAMVDGLNWDGTASKFIDTVLIIILNYILRKLWVFKPRRNAPQGVPSEKGLSGGEG